MIAEWDTNHLFLSDRLQSKEPALFASLCLALNGVPIDIIPGTNDIWCRGYMPLQLDESRFCQFVYAPDYLREDQHLITPPEMCRLPFMQDYRQEPIVLDGGNVVASRTKVILTDKVYDENPSIEPLRVSEQLERVFRAECIFIPQDSGDEVGHSDGVVRFVSENRVLINDYSTVDSGYGEKVRGVLEKKGLEVETLPMFEEEGNHWPDDLPSAVGIYVNYLRIGNFVVVPGFGRSEDQIAVEKVRQVMPDAKVFQLPCRSLAEEGGVLNCISWTIKRKALIPA